MAQRLRCRAAGRTYNIWSRQCEHPAKSGRYLDGPTGPFYAVCGIHYNARYASVYRPREGSRYESPVQEYMR
jgi:hypothetical protein